ncbi:hypothetical protein KIN20_020324 [Parelaphostrongylus tenuis]|uniref:Uncharacterized protein n=1 Tax=Parelaphostrongylus tenuis TaxID=148309 RepID=A0AAD5QVH4_PARTN|nr:hypothetical protein KIN20_020324 [Parelaphostrongylus tenuis]
MTPLYPEESAQKRPKSNEMQRPKSPFDAAQAIVPVEVLYMGKTAKHVYDRCIRANCLGPSMKPCVVVTMCEQWSKWSAWSMCSVTCGEGERKRTRECIGGLDCPGVSMISDAIRGNDTSPHGN